MLSPQSKRHHSEKKDEAEEGKHDPTHEKINDESGLVSRYSALYNNQHLSDVVLRVGPERYHAHKFVLISASEVFEAMLGQRQWSESREAEVELTEEDDCISVFSIFLKYLYSGTVNVSTDSVLPLLLLADKYSISVLQESCIEYMLRHIVASPDTNRTLTWYQYANMTEQEKLKVACRQFILSNFDVILDAPDWPEMTKDELAEFLTSSELVISSELHLWQRVEKWLTCEVNRDMLETNLKEILPLLRFTMILPKDLVSIEESDLFKNYVQEFAEKLNHAYRHHSLVPECGSGENKREQFRNYYSEDYGLCFPLKLEDYPCVSKIDSRITLECHVPAHYMPSSRQCNKSSTGFMAYFYPRGYYTTITLYGTYINRQSDLTTLKLYRKTSEHVAMQVEVTLVLYGKKNSLRYVAFTHTSKSLIWKECVNLIVDNVIDLERLTDEDSPYLIDGTLEGKIFVKIQDVGAHLLPTDNE